MRNGHVFRQVLWEPATKEIAGGLLPTPRANSAMTVDLRTQQNRPELQPNLETVMARMMAVVREEPQMLSELGVEVPPEMERILASCLAKRPEDRYQHVDQLLSELNALSA